VSPSAGLELKNIERYRSAPELQQDSSAVQHIIHCTDDNAPPPNDDDDDDSISNSHNIAKPYFVYTARYLEIYVREI
jgi:hypothetical protein